MRRPVVLVVVAFLIVTAAAPASAHWHGDFWVGFGVGTLFTAPFWFPPSVYYLYPAYYPYQSYSPYPAYVYPSPLPAYPAYTPPASAAPATTTPTPSPLSPPPRAEGAPPAGEQKCETVWVEGHYETHVGAGGQASTVWVPGGSRQICQ